MINDKEKDKLIYIFCFLEKLYKDNEKAVKRYKEQKSIVRHLNKQIINLGLLQLVIVNLLGYDDYELFIEEVIKKSGWKDIWETI